MISRNFIALFLGQVGPQLVSFAALPFISRLYLPSEIGNAYFWLSATAIITLVLSGQLHYANLSARCAFSRGATLIDAVTVYSVIGGVLLAVSPVLAIFLGGMQEIPQDGNFSVELIVLLVAIQLFSPLMLAVLSRGRSLSLFLVYTSTKAISTAALQIILPKLGFASMDTLMATYVAGELFAAITQRPAISRIYKIALHRYRHKGISNFGKYRTYVTKFTPSQLAALVANFLPLAVLRSANEMEALALYTLLMRLIATPVNSASQSLRYLYSRTLATASTAVRSAVEVRFFVNINLAFIVISAVLYFSPIDILQFILGPKWRSQEVAFASCCLWLGSSLGNVMRSERFRQLGYHGRLLRFEIIGLAFKAFVAVVLFAIGAVEMIYLFFLAGYVTNLGTYQLLGREKFNENID